MLVHSIGRDSTGLSDSYDVAALLLAGEEAQIIFRHSPSPTTGFPLSVSPKARPKKRPFDPWSRFVIPSSGCPLAVRRKLYFRLGGLGGPQSPLPLDRASFFFCSTLPLGRRHHTIMLFDLKLTCMRPGLSVSPPRVAYRDIEISLIHAMISR